METENTEIKEDSKIENPKAIEESIAELETDEKTNDVQKNGKKELTQDQAMRKSLKVSYAIRTIAGFYLIYVAFRMYQTMDLNTGATRAVSNIFMLFFAVIGLVMIISSFNGNKKLRK